jgi:acyl-CoA synthetase (NDP forming)
MLPAGHVALATQSGALGFALPELLRSQNLGICSLVSLGNKLDLGENDFLQYWLSDPAARTILLYLESFQNPRELLDLGRQLSRTRPVLLLKAGRTTAGSRAAGSHTAALATPDRLADGLCRQAGILRVETLEEMLHVSSLVSAQPLPRGKRVIVLTNAGGLGVLCTDALEKEGCEVPELSIALQEKLRGLVPTHATVRNPIDLVASVEPQLIGHCLKCLLASDEVDSAVILYVPRLPGTSLDIARAIHQSTCAAQRTKTVLTVFAEGEQVIARLQQELKGIPCFRYPESAAKALAVAAKHAARQRVSELPRCSVDHTSTTEARQIVNQFFAEHGEHGAWLPPAAMYRLLDSLHLPMPAWQVARSKEMAVDAARNIGYPIVMKAIAPDLLHKSAAGGVVLDVRNGEETRDAWRSLAESFSGLTGVLVQQYIRGGDEAIIGAKWEADFGHVIGLGAGGIRVESLQQMEFRLLPLARRDAYALIRDSAIAEFCLDASRQLTASGAAMFEALLRLSALVSAIPEINDLDLNPVALLPSPGSLCVLDGRIHVGGCRG